MPLRLSKADERVLSRNGARITDADPIGAAVTKLVAALQSIAGRLGGERKIEVQSGPVTVAAPTITVEPTPITVAAPAITVNVNQPRRWTFQIERGGHGEIRSITAEAQE